MYVVAANSEILLNGDQCTCFHNKRPETYPWYGSLTCRFGVIRIPIILYYQKQIQLILPLN